MKIPNLYSLIIILFFLSLIYVPFDSFSQTEFMPNDKEYPMGKLYLNSNKIIKTSRITLIGDSTLTFFMPASSASTLVSVDEIRFVKLKVGSQAGKFSLIGAGTMVVSSLIAFADISADPFSEPKDNAGIVVLGFIGGGALVGALIGSAVPKWKTFHIQKKEANLDLSLLTSSLNPISGYASLSLSLTF